METSKQHNHPSNERAAGFMSGMDFDGFIQDARLPAHGRSADMAEDRQGGGGGAGFNSPGFNIPFTPNFQFNEFSSPFGNGNSFSTFLSGLGGSSQLATQGDFVEQTEQRFTRPQIGGAQIQGGQFKRETPKSHQNHQSLKNHQNMKNHQNLKHHQNPSHRYESAQYEQPKINFKQPESFKRPQPVYTPKNEALPKGNFQQFYNPQVREDTKEPVYQEIFDQQTRNQDFKVESRESVFDQKKFEDFAGKSKNMEKLFDQQESNFPETKFDMKFEPAKFVDVEERKTPKDNGQQTFSPPALIEQFKSPMKHSEPYPFQVANNKQEPYAFQAPFRKPQESEPNKQAKVKPFTNVGEKYKSESKNVFNPSKQSNSKPTPRFEPGFTKFNPVPKKTQKKIQATKKPYQYEKKNFREPVKQVNRNPGPHQLIRIKAKRNQKPQPKQLQLGPSRQSQRDGFRPIPGKMIIEEVVRRKEPYRHQEVVYDNQQPLITLDSVSDGNHFKASNNQDSFAVNVQASFAPKPENQRQRVQKRRGLIHLPALTLPSRNQKRQRRLLIAEDPHFESAKITRPSSMDTAFVLDTDNFDF